MTVRTFDVWSASQGRSTTASLSVLKDTVLGIDAAHYLDKILEGGKKEPFVNALGGTPFTLRQSLETDITRFREAGIKPLFIFSGCSIVRTEKPFSTPDEAARNRAQSWELYDQGKKKEAINLFMNTGIGHPQERFRIMMRTLRDKGVDFQVAPYASWPQLAYLEKTDYIDCIWGPTEVLFWDVEKLITNVNLETKQFTFVSKPTLRQNISLQDEQFTDACLLSGSQLIRPLPSLRGPSLFADAAGLVKQFRSVGNAITSREQQNTQYLEKFRKARAAIKHHVIMKEDGTVEQLDKQDSPDDVHEFIGQRLPDELYFYLSRGIIGPQMLEMLTTGELIVPQPLDSLDSEAYKKFQLDLNSMRTEALSMLTKPLVRYWSARDVKVYYWYDPQNPRTLTPKEVQPPSDLAQNWNVKEPVFGAAMDRQNQDWGEFAFCITSLEDEAYAAQTIAPKDPKDLLVKQDEIRISAIYRMLQLRGFVDGVTHKLTSWGHALSKAVKRLETEDSSIIIPLWTALELYRIKAVKADNIFGSCSGAATAGANDKENRFITLISRVCSLVPLDHKQVGYEGPLNRSITAFTSFSRALTKELRNYLEMVLVNLLMAGDADRSDHTRDWAVLGLKLPFVDDTGAAFGIAAQTYLQDLCAEKDPTSLAAKARVSEQMSTYFPHAVDIASDLEIGWGFFDSFVEGVKSLAEDGIMVAESKEFIEANKWLSSRRMFFGPTSSGKWSDE